MLDIILVELYSKHNKQYTMSLAVSEGSLIAAISISPLSRAALATKRPILPNPVSDNTNQYQKLESLPKVIDHKNNKRKENIERKNKAGMH